MKKTIWKLTAGSALTLALLSAGCDSAVNTPVESTISLESTAASSVDPESASSAVEASPDSNSTNGITDSSANPDSASGAVDSSTTSGSGNGTADSSDAFRDSYDVYLVDLMGETLQQSYTSSTLPIRVEESEEWNGKKTSKLINVSRELPGLSDGDFNQSITGNLNLPAECSGIQIRWCSSDESLLESNGTIHRPHDRSRFVVLSGEFTEDENTLIKRYTLRIERDMYDSRDFNDVFPLEYYGDYYYAYENNIDLSDLDGWCYIIDDPELLYFYEGDVENLTVWSFQKGQRNKLQVSGLLAEMNVESRHEADLLIYSLKDLLGADISKGSLRLNCLMPDTINAGYDYSQYFKDVRVPAGMLRLFTSYKDRNKSLNSSLLSIPDDFDVTPAISSEEVQKKVPDGEDPELIIDLVDDTLHLIWLTYDAHSSERVYIDAKTGEELRRSSTIIVN